MSIEIPHNLIETFCRKWRIVEFALFGSVIREDFRPDSDIDVLVTFEPEAPWSLRHIVDMKDELEAIFGRRIDIVEKKAIRNPIRRKDILNSFRVVYAA